MKFDILFQKFMENSKMTIVKINCEDAKEQLLIGASTFYGWYNAKKFEVEEDKDTNIKYLLIEEDTVQKIRAKNLKKKHNKNISEDSEVFQNEPENTVIDAEYSRNDNQKIPEYSEKLQWNNPLELMKYVADLSAKAGKYELLTDKSKELKDDSDHWQNKYHELNYKYKKISEDYEKLQNEHNKLLENSKKEQKQAWWKLGKN